MRRILSGAIVSVSLIGCSNGETTDPSKLPPMTDADFAEINARDQEIDDEEGKSFSEPKGKASKAARSANSEAMDR